MRKYRMHNLSKQSDIIQAIIHAVIQVLFMPFSNCVKENNSKDSSLHSDAN